jgi:hypothetical protein
MRDNAPAMDELMWIFPDWGAVRCARTYRQQIFGWGGGVERADFVGVRNARSVPEVGPGVTRRASSPAIERPTVRQVFPLLRAVRQRQWAADVQLRWFHQLAG